LTVVLLYWARRALPVNYSRRQVRVFGMDSPVLSWIKELRWPGGASLAGLRPATQPVPAQLNLELESENLQLKQP
jgi:hypothetical protein